MAMAGGGQDDGQELRCGMVEERPPQMALVLWEGHATSLHTRTRLSLWLSADVPLLWPLLSRRRCTEPRGTSSQGLCGQLGSQRSGHWHKSRGCCLLWLALPRHCCLVPSTPEEWFISTHTVSARAQVAPLLSVRETGAVTCVASPGHIDQLGLRLRSVPPLHK